MLYIWSKLYLIISKSEWGRTKREHIDVPLFWKHCSRSRYLLSYWVSSSRPRRDESSTLCKYFKFILFFFGWISYLWGCLTWQPRLEESFVLPCLLQTESLDWVGDRLPGTCNKSFICRHKKYGWWIFKKSTSLCYGLVGCKWLSD